MVGIRRRIARIPDKVCARLGLSRVYATPVGIKCMNRPIRDENFRFFVSGDPRPIAVEKLRMPRDDLKDPHTLLGTPLLESPHSELMRCLAEGRDPTGTEYARRFATGTLDPRRPRKPEPDWWRRLFTQHRMEIEAGHYAPIHVASDGQHTYIADGKHRAALCALVGVTPMCVDVSQMQYDSFYLAVCREMRHNPESYSRHLQYFERLFDGI